MSQRLENVFAVLVGVFWFVPLYIGATMNALGDFYFFGIDKFLSRFYFFHVASTAILLLSFVGAIFWRLCFKRPLALARKVAIAIACACCIVTMLGQSPCFYPHVDPHSLETIVKQALFCPSYSNRSYIGLILTATFCGFIILVSWSRKKQYS